jgi:hypothetical protein
MLLYFASRRLVSSMFDIAYQQISTRFSLQLVPSLALKPFLQTQISYSVVPVSYPLTKLCFFQLFVFFASSLLVLNSFEGHSAN